MDLIEQDQLQRLQALDATQSFIVQAPAGSGKTELLIQRFLTLLTTVKIPEEILAITFTKKAANEMRLRLLKALKQATENEPESAHAKKTWYLANTVLKRDKQFNWNLLTNPNQLRIQTIDSLCTYLTKQLPLLSHFGSQPDIADNPSNIYREAVREVLLHVEESYEWSQSISNLLLHLDNDLNKLHDLFVNLLAKRDQWLPYIHLDSHSEQIKKNLESQLGYIVSDHLQTLRKLFPKSLVQDLMSSARFAADNIALKQVESPILANRDKLDLPDTRPHDLTAWLGLATLLLTKTGTWRKQLNDEIGFPPLTSIKNALEKKIHTEHRQRLAAIIAQLNEQDDLRLALAELAFLPRPFYEKNQWEVLQSLLTVLKILAAQLRLSFQQHGQIDFIENAQAALIALGSVDAPTDLALALDYQIRHILVDEFQDTSYTQYQLLQKLTAGWETNDGRTLFVVGDPMQSIYRFREAEVGLFIGMRANGLGAIKLTPLTLARNFRSLAPIVNWNNYHFQAIFPKFNDIATGAVTYSPSISSQDTTSLKQISVKGFNNFPDTAQADYVINLIHSTREQQPQSKIAILVRSRGHLAKIIPALKKAQIPFHAVDIDPLVSRQHIQDLLALTCAMLHPADRIAWLTVLRAPWCGLSLADMLVIAGSDAHATIWEHLERDDLRAALSADGKQRLERIFAVLRNKILERDRHDLRSWIETTWQLIGGPAALKDASEINDADEFFKLLTAVSDAGQSINIEKLKEKIAKLYATSSPAENSVQIMTIHSSKGLEFDVVILPHLERKMPLDDKSLLVWMERPLANSQTALLLAPIHKTGSDKDLMYEFINRQHKLKSEYEVDRLFYVATTRAKQQLHLVFAVKAPHINEYTPEHGSFLKKLWPFIMKDAANIIEENPELNLTTNETAPSTLATQRPIRRLSLDWQNPVQLNKIFQFNAHQKQAGFLLADTNPKIIGIVIHRILQLIAINSLGWWQSKDKSAHLQYIHSLLLQRGMLIKNLNSAAHTVLTAIANTLTDPRGQWILHQHTDSRSEYAITANLHSQVTSLVIDRTFIDADGTRWIIDYKTTAFSHEDLDSFLLHEQDKYLEKMQMYREAFALLDQRMIRLGLYFPVLKAWKEW